MQSYLERFQAWLSAYPAKQETLFLLATLLFLEIAIVMNLANLEFAQCNCSIYEYIDMLTPELDGDSLLLYVFVAIVEELIFRIIPLGLALKWWGTRLPTVIVLLVSSILFGVVHGSLLNIFIQGPGGLMYALLFIKYSQPDPRYVINFFAVERDTQLTWDRFVFASLMIIWLHFLYNTVLYVFLSALSGSPSLPPLI